MNMLELIVLSYKISPNTMEKMTRGKTSKVFKVQTNEVDYLEEYNTTIIHGDLGAWNFIYDGMNISFIDFGEMRLGSPWLVIAAVVESLKLNDQQIKFLVKGFTGGDNENNDTLNNMRKK